MLASTKNHDMVVKALVAMTKDDRIDLNIEDTVSGCIYSGASR